MKLFIISAFLLATAYARPGATNVDVTQDTAGNYKYLVDGDAFKQQEERFADGSVTGFYSYIDANGMLIMYKYVSGPQGFKIVDGPVPVAPVEVVPVPEVAPLPVAPVVHAALEFPTASVQQFNIPSTFNILPEGWNSAPVAFNDAPVDLGLPVTDTPEVAAAKAAHFAAHAAAQHA